jgi:integrase
MGATPPQGLPPRHRSPPRRRRPIVALNRLRNRAAHHERLLGENLAARHHQLLEWVRRDTKTHQQRRIALDDETIAVLREHVRRVDGRAAQLGLDVGREAYLFTLAPDASTPLQPDTATQRYERMAERLGIRTTLHKLRHYSATELIAAGVDVRTIAGRLGHGGGGTTTLKVYAAFVNEADQRAAAVLAQRMTRPT